MTRNKNAGPLDGSTSGTIGGGGPETGGPTPRPTPPETPPVHPEDAASGRLAPDPLGAAAQRDDLKTPPTDVNSGGHMANEQEKEPGDREQIGRRGMDDEITNVSEEEFDEDDDMEDEDDDSEDLQ
jgi:hypothetical protein